jgi:hypothetical protein
MASYLKKGSSMLQALLVVGLSLIGAPAQATCNPTCISSVSPLSADAGLTHSPQYSFTNIAPSTANIQAVIVSDPSITYSSLDPVNDFTASVVISLISGSTYHMQVVSLGTPLTSGGTYYILFEEYDSDTGTYNYLTRLSFVAGATGTFQAHGAFSSTTYKSADRSHQDMSVDASRVSSAGVLYLAGGLRKIDGSNGAGAGVYKFDSNLNLVTSYGSLSGANKINWTSSPTPDTWDFIRFFPENQTSDSYYDASAPLSQGSLFLFGTSQDTEGINRIQYRESDGAIDTLWSTSEKNSNPANSNPNIGVNWGASLGSVSVLGGYTQGNGKTHGMAIEYDHVADTYGSIVTYDEFSGTNTVTEAVAVSNDGVVYICGTTQSSTIGYVFLYQLSAYDLSINTWYGAGESNPGHILFGTSSLYQGSTATGSQAHCSGLFADDKENVIMTGYYDTTTSGKQEAFVMSFNPDGTLNGNFGGIQLDPWASTSLSGYAGQVFLIHPTVSVQPKTSLLLADGSILIAGTEPSAANSAITQAFVTRLTSAGTLDTGFAATRSSGTAIPGTFWYTAAMSGSAVNTAGAAIDVDPDTGYYYLGGWEYTSTYNGTAIPNAMVLSIF